MIGKVIFWLFIIALISSIGYFGYQYIPGKAEGFKIVDLTEKTETNISYGNTPMFMTNMRFSEKEFSYYVSPDCSLNRQERMKRAFSIIQNETKLSFYEIDNNKDANILVGCSQEEIEESKNTFRAGEGGPTAIFDTGLYNLSLKGQIKLYRETSTDCGYPVVELHELLHVFGFDHSPDQRNIMYNTSDCEQRISQDIIDTLNALYSSDSLPDIYISNISAIKRGRYLDFNISMRNRGLVDVKENVTLIVETNGEQIQTYIIGAVYINTTRILRAENVRLPSRGTNKIDFLIDSENKVRELFENNNRVNLIVPDS